MYAALRVTWFSLVIAIGGAAFGDELQDLAKQLSSPKFGERQEASQKLEEAGQDALPVLKEAAEGASREASIRAIEVLQKHIAGEDAELKTAAEKALKEISESENQIASARAKAAIEPPAQPQGQFPQIGNRVIGNVQIQVMQRAGARRIQMRNNNGNREIEAEEDGSKYKIQIDAAGKIKMQITEKKDGKETVKKLEAKDADDLKKQDAEAHKIFEKYSKQNIQIRNIQIGAGGIKLPQVLPVRPAVPAIPVRPARPNIAPKPNNQKIIENLEKAQKDLEESKAKMEKMADESEDKDRYQSAIKSLEEAQKRLEEMKKRFAE